MKQKDIALIAVIVIISVVMSIIISGMIFGSPSKREMKAEVVQPISANLTQPDKQFFNDQAIDPTKLITIGQNDNQSPFTGEGN